MRRIAVWFAVTATVVILLLGYHTSTNREPMSAVGGTEPGLPGGAAAGSSSSRTAQRPKSPGARSGHSHKPSTSATRKKATKPKPSSAPAKVVTYTGPTVQTYRGPVQVRIGVRSGKITNVEVPIHPNDNPVSQQINNYAVPVLVRETLSAQSDKIDMVSGATITSQGYEQSLQSALDQAGI